MWKTFSLVLAKHSQSIVPWCSIWQLWGIVMCAPCWPTPANRAQCWVSCRPCYKKGGFLPTEPTIRGGCLLSFRLPLCYSALAFQVRYHSPTLQFFAELHFDHQTVAHWSQFCCKAMLSFILICPLQLFLNGGWQGVAKLWKYMIDASAGKCVIAASCTWQCAFLLVSSGNRGHLSCTCRWSLRWDIARNH